MASTAHAIASKFVPHVGDVTLSHVEAWWPGGKIKFCPQRDDEWQTGRWYPEYHQFPTFANDKESEFIVLNVYGSVKHCKTCKCRDALMHLEMVLVVKRQLVGPSHYIEAVEFTNDAGPYNLHTDQRVLKTIQLKKQGTADGFGVLFT
jgi:hypothetical protein